MSAGVGAMQRGREGGGGGGGKGVEKADAVALGQEEGFAVAVVAF